ncbi:DUF2752 domain-containing protein [Streptomyces sp. NBC_01236]|uniref:DUF2752 domain-containing protein n=1 Tax=Streptomyces sp. NBC_01236 TaxID=2903789 RepID=UPI002E117887|nr:DUF2752 domain-containing protein [Streptomyces sp. NBC_01236]
MAHTHVPPGAPVRARWLPQVRLGWETQNARWWWLGLAGAVVVLAGSVMAVWGMFPIDLHEPTHYAGIMAPTCGLTRSVVAVFRGDLAMAWRYNPAGLLVAGVSVAILARLVWGTAVGRGPVLRIRPGRIGWIALGLALVALEIRQQGQAPLLMTTGLR